MSGTRAVYRKSRRARDSDDYETWIEDTVGNTLTPFDASPSRATVLAVGRSAPGRPPHGPVGSAPAWCGCCPDDLLPDGPRYRALGNAVSVPVAEWIGRRLKSNGWPPYTVPGAGTPSG